MNYVLCANWRNLPQPASWTLRSLSPWSGTSCRSPGPLCSRSFSSWSISLWHKRQDAACCRCDLGSGSEEVSLKSLFVTTNLVGWWFRRYRTRTVWPGPWTGAWRLRWWCRCSALWDEPEETDVLLCRDVATFPQVLNLIRRRQTTTTQQAQ